MTELKLRALLEINDILNKYQSTMRKYPNQQQANIVSMFVGALASRLERQGTIDKNDFFDSLGIAIEESEKIK